MKTKSMAKSYIVSKEILPEAIIKTAQAKELLLRGEALTVNEAVDKVGISRSAFYKYRDGVTTYRPGPASRGLPRRRRESCRPVSTPGYPPLSLDLCVGKW